METTAVILAAGLGTRMRSTLPKAMHTLGGQTMLARILQATRQVFDKTVVVIGPDMDTLRKEAEHSECYIQTERMGTAHAALEASEGFGAGLVAILFADNPLVTPNTLARLLNLARQTSLVMLAMETEDKTLPYGRIILKDDGTVERIVEYADATDEERKITLCMTGGFCAQANSMRRWLKMIRPNNSKGEFYLTDLAAIASQEGAQVKALIGTQTEMMGINSPEEMKIAEILLGNTTM
jgi:bifunctional UDP-N-acetylglucosamine pyrophosphorylase / glucosamine-1-phosphate N-acetyltransferase